MISGKPTTDHHYVGMRFRVWGDPARIGTCVWVTPWGNDQIRWVRLSFEDGTQKSYAPSHLLRVKP